MKLIKTGATRWVLLTKNYAFKFPAFHGYGSFLKGLLANMQEKRFSTVQVWGPKICPVVFYIKGGFLVVMPRCRELLENEISMRKLNKYAFINSNWKVPAEIKANSWGYLNGKLVAFDYGN